MKNNFIQRAITGVLFVLILIGGILFSPLSFGILFTLIAALCVHEFAHLINRSGTANINPTITALGAAALFLAMMGYCTSVSDARIFLPYLLLLLYLMIAESVLRGGTGYSRSEALGFLNDLRERAYGDTSGNITDAQMNLDYIIDERGRELYLECVRRTDLIRFGRFTSDHYLWQWKGGVLAGRGVDSRYNVYPIPANEIAVNSNLSNPNY